MDFRGFPSSGPLNCIGCSDSMESLQLQLNVQPPLSRLLSDPVDRASLHFALVSLSHTDSRVPGLRLDNPCGNADPANPP